MKLKDICACLDELGWHISTDEVGDKVASLELADRIVNLIPDIRVLPTEEQLAISPAVSNSVFCDVCRIILNETTGYAPLVCSWESNQIRAPEISKLHVRRMSDEAIAWAEKQDLDQALRDYASLPTNAPGARPIWHLGALVMLGNITKLKCYLTSFDVGDRLGFVNYVTKDHIERAILLSEKISISE